MLALDIYFSVFTFTVAHAHPVSNPSFDYIYIFFFKEKFVYFLEASFQTLKSFKLRCNFKEL